MQIAKNPDQLEADATTIVGGVQTHFHAWGIPKAIVDLTGGALKELQEKNLGFRQSAAQLTSILQKDIAQASTVAERQLNGAVKILRIVISERWTPGWGEAGFVNQNTQVPENDVDRLRLLEKLAPAFALHPNWENDKLGITAKSLTEATAALGSALTMQSAQEAEHKKTVTARDRATAKLRSRLRALLNELSLHLADDDPRWEVLGLKTPHSERAAKDARKEKAAQKAEDQQIRKLEVATRKYEVAKARSERLRVRADQQEAILFRLRQEQANAVNDAEALFRAVQELATEIGHPLPATLPRNVQPEAASDSTVSNNGNGQVKIELHS